MAKLLKEFHWTDSHEHAFQHLKTLFTSSPCLTHFDSEKDIELYTDASDHAISAVLAHEVDGVRHPIAFWSRCLTKSELNYTIYQKEFLALFASAKKFKLLLVARPFTVFLDNKGVSYLKTLKLSQSCPRTARYVTFLNQFRFDVRVIPSKLNPADMLSRQQCLPSQNCPTCLNPQKFLPVPFTFGDCSPLPPMPTESKAVQTPARIPTCTQTADINLIETDDLHTAQEADADIHFLKQKLLDATTHQITLTDTNQFSACLRKLAVWIPNLVIHRKLLSVQVTDLLTNNIYIKPILPLSLYDTIAQNTHASTLRHAGADKVIDFVKSKCVAPGFAKHARLITAKCIPCATQKAYTKNLTAPSRSIPPSAAPGEFLSCDHSGPFPSAQGYQYILAITCNTSKHLTLLPQKSVSAIETARALLTHFKYYGIPKLILSDNGTAFKNALHAELLQSLNIKSLFATPGHPQGNSRVERVNSFLKDLLTISANYHPGSWPDHLTSIQSVYNCSVHQGTHYTPNFLFFGRELALPNSVLDSHTSTQLDNTCANNTLEQHALGTALRLKEALHNAQKSNEHRLKIAKTHFDRHAATINTFQKGQLVFLKQPGRKLQLRYPQQFMILRKLHTAEYEIQNTSNPSDVRKMNICRLKPYLQPLLPDKFDKETQCPNSPCDAPTLTHKTPITCAQTITHAPSTGNNSQNDKGIEKSATADSVLAAARPTATSPSDPLLAIPTTKFAAVAAQRHHELRPGVTNSDDTTHIPLQTTHTASETARCDHNATSKQFTHIPITDCKHSNRDSSMRLHCSTESDTTFAPLSNAQLAFATNRPDDTSEPSIHIYTGDATFTTALLLDRATRSAGPQLGAQRVYFKCLNPRYTTPTRPQCRAARHIPR